MKKIFYCLIGMLVSLCFMASCTDDSADNPTFDADETPYIYTSLSGNADAKVGIQATFPVIVSPNDGSTSVRWLLDSVVIATTPTLTYTFNTAGTYSLRIEAERNGITNHRDFALTVTEP